MTATAHYARLHITPLDQDLVDIIIPAAVRPYARNLSFHTIGTFPERRYGFVDLPTADADRLRKKLHGCVFHNVKMSVECARPEHARVHEPISNASAAAAAVTEPVKNKKRTGLKKRKPTEAVLDGFELPAGRKVKRSWTVPAAADTTGSSAVVKSKYSDRPELLFVQKLPPNAPVVEGEKPRNGRSVIIHELERTRIFPSFLRGPPSGGANVRQVAQFEEGRGWLDDDGNLVEAVTTRRTRHADLGLSQHSESPQRKVDAIGKSESRAGDDSDRGDNNTTPARQTLPSPPDVVASPEALQLQSPWPTRSLTVKIPRSLKSEAPDEESIHPLQALYKPDAIKQAKDSFAFFEREADDVQVSHHQDHDAPARAQAPALTLTMPMTPFTQQDLEWRQTRSAAPTPDTAHPSRIRAPLWDNMSDQGVTEPAIEQAEADKGAEPADFSSWFWENRAELDRSWARRRKTAAKERRYRGNKARVQRRS